MTRQSLAALRQVFEVQQPNAIEVDTRQLLITIARRGIAKITSEQTSRAGVEPSVKSYANTPGRPIEQVTLPGPIVARFDYRKEIAVVGLDMVRKASPVQSGEYVKNHTILLNGAEVDVLPPVIQETDVITLTNPVPYARRIEIGKTKSGRDFVIQVPNRIYERVAKGLLSKYRNVAKIEFTYIDTAGAHTIQGKLSPSYTVGEFAPGGRPRQRKRRQKAGTNVRAPAIVIRPLLERVV